ncbi:SAM-dependent methyltransferase [Haloferula sp.]|uniref:SAM-dependent methyltransferase n=1 Tax=Haloferula sp. TaxID=2497595 RepID=UPI00329CC7D4
MQANRPSDTATLIARSILLAAQKPRLQALVADQEPATLRRILAASGTKDWFTSVLDFAPARQLLLCMERFLLSGIIPHYLVRKRQIENSVEWAIANGCKRLVILGAGFDTLAWRLQRKHPQVQFIELDHPSTQQIKRQALGETSNLHYRSLDLNLELPSSALASFGSSQNDSTTFIMEGLTMYLPHDRVVSLMKDAATIAGPTGTLVFTFMERDANGSIGFRGENPLIAQWLDARNEPFLWGISRNDLPGFLKANGIHQVELTDHVELRHRHLAPRGLEALPLAQGELICTATPLDDELDCNDKHSKLNQTRVAEVQHPRSEQAVIDAIKEAATNGQSVSICGARHAMGGQQFGSDTLLLDLSRLNDVHHLNTRHGFVETGAGIMWRELIDELHARQADHEIVWSIRQKQTGADDLTIGGSLAANIHGRGLRMKPIISDVEAFTLIDGEGRRHRCSRKKNRELFSLAIGGYGCFGVITSVLLRLAPRQKLERVVELTTIDKLIPTLEERIESGCLYGDFQFSIDETSPDFLHCGILSSYRPVEPSRPIPEDRKELSDDDWKELIHLAHHDRPRAFKIYSDFYLGTHGSLYWSDTHQLSVYLNDYHSQLDHECRADVPASEMISELYVPREYLAKFMKAAAKRLRNGSVPLIYGTVRLIQRDDESHLAWARDDYACIIFNLHTEHSEEGIARSSDAFRSLIDLALSYDGSYYLTYHRWARRDQIEQAHPRFARFLEKKEEFDPSQRFQSEWWRHHQQLFQEA